jgi:3-methyladenine DNA glycosylase AlkD
VSAADVKAALAAEADPAKAAFFPSFFKTEPGQYGEGDQFIGVTVPKQRAIARAHRTLPLTDIETLLQSPIHEHRLTALLILVLQYQKADAAARRSLADFYLAHKDRVNNWDLVDSSAPYILGPELDRLFPTLERLAASASVWDRRIAMLGAGGEIRSDRFDRSLRIADVLINDKHDLIHKAVGWMLREIGKKDQAVEEAFLAKHYRTMPRTMLRYAIERFPAERRAAYLAGTV